ncbi:hypothetical protein ACGFNP_07110 [Nonomuraea sp. NPDC049269]|uniref:hypothetical protein n=1 Tax=Nonomuraea sp. NPDC049269 TaxID=3364349 RepID=UPI003719DF0E
MTLAEMAVEALAAAADRLPALPALPAPTGCPRCATFDDWRSIAVSEGAGLPSSSSGLLPGSGGGFGCSPPLWSARGCLSRTWSPGPTY